MEKFLETNFFDEHSIHRLSENENDFHGPKARPVAKSMLA
jgi:hypothetical protein